MTLTERMRSFAIDHEPHGWPAVQMRDISALCDKIARLNMALKNIASLSQTDNLLWWQIEARTALDGVIT